MSSNAARKLDLPSADDLVDSPGSKATEEFVTSQAFEILRAWAALPDITQIMAEAERVKAAEATREG